jgi:capsule biosynthesis phosphatase
LRFCFDLDNTLVTLPKIVGDYESVEPIWKNINYLKFLKNIGHTIIIHTARRMKTHNGNVGAVISDIGPVTIETLKKYEIPYDELYFGKPYAHFYIDDLAVNANSNIENFIGIHNIQTKPRHFNEVDIKENTVEKKTSNLGEIYWYRNIPEKILNLFPKIINYSDNRLTIEKINGVTFSYLFTHKTLTKTNITHLLSELEKIHNSLDVLEKINVYQNYYEKLKERYSTNFDLYSKYDLEKTFSVLETLLLDYELKNEGTPSVIHGDTVFTNIILTEKNDIKFIDMRGKLGEELTIYGDKYYDYSKIYQSLLGYDFILNDMEIDTLYCEELLILFESFFSQKELKKIKMITASLFFSLIPLHEENHSKYKKYIMIIENLIQDISKTTI